MEEAQEIKNISPKGVSLEIGEEGFIEGISFKLLEGEARITQGSIKITLNGKMQIEKLLLETDKEADVYLKKVAFFKQVRVDLQEDSTLKVSFLDERFWPIIFSTDEPSSIELPYPSVTVMRGVASPGRGGGGAGGGNGGGGQAQESFTANMGLQNLTNNIADDHNSAWSPDGQKIAFESDRDGSNEEIYVMNAADGTNQTNLTNSPAGGNWGPSWSPDGSKIAFQSDRDGNREIYVMNADGTNQTRLTNSASFDDSPSFSPDGGKIAFTVAADVYVMNADGTNQTNLTNSPAGGTWHPSWSPDGSKIAFSSGRDGNYEVYVMDQDGSSQTRLTNNPANDFWPAWSPDGQRIAFITNRDGNNEIYTMNLQNYYFYTLSNTPTSITSVTVNGNPVAEDPTNGWTLSGNQLTFNGTSLPNQGDTVAIDYQY